MSRARTHAQFLLHMKQFVDSFEHLVIGIWKYYLEIKKMIGGCGDEG